MAVIFVKRLTDLVYLSADTMKVQKSANGNRKWSKSLLIIL